MTEKTEDLKNGMLTAATRLRALRDWSCSEGYRSKLLETMQEGGVAATDAWVCLLKEVVKLPPPGRHHAEKLLSEYQQAIGRWFIAVHNEHFSNFSLARAGMAKSPKVTSR